MPILSPATLTQPCRRHHHHHPIRRHHHCLPTTIVAVAISLATVVIASSSPATLITIAIALATLTCPLCHPLVSSPSPSLHYLSEERQ